MGSNRVIPASATTTQTHTPSGLSSPPLPVLDMSSSIKSEPSTHLDGAMNAHCHSENWAESYQDLSSWCSATSASSPATCPTPVTDETIVTEIDFQGEIDFDLRKSEEIASIPLEEDNSFNLWGAGSPLGENSPPAASVSAVPSTEESNPVLLKDCWWSEVETGKVVKELESSKPQNLTASTYPSMKNPFNQEPISAVVIKEEVIDTKENMNPIVAPQPQAQPQALLQPFLSDPIKMAELQMRFERIASIAQPGGNSKSKAADLMKLLQGQIVALNKKKYRSPAAISDLHNQQTKVHAGPTVHASETLHSFSQPSVVGNADDIFQVDPFDGLFSVAESQSQAAHPIVSQTASPQMFFQNATVAPAFIQNTFHTSPGKVIPAGAGNIAPRNSNLFFEAHHEILKEAPKPQQLSNVIPQHQPVAQLPVQPVVQSIAQLPLQQQFAGPQQAYHQVHSSVNTPVPSHPQRSASGITMQRPPLRLSMPELDAINFDALLFGSPGTLAGVSKMQSMMSTPEVLKPLVDTPELENFDLLSYLCDDKAATPPVGLDSSNPFRFPQASTSQSTLASNSTSSAAPELKPNVMVVKPMSTALAKEEVSKTESAVVVEVKPQIRPVVLSDVEEEEVVEAEREPTTPARSVKEEQVSSRPSRSSRKRKYSEDEFDLSPSPSEETRPSRRRRTTSSKYDSDEDFTVPSRKSPKKSLTSISEEEEDTKVKRPRSSVKRGERSVSTSSESDRYRELRDRNNEASRKSRLTRKARETELGKQAEVLTRENRVLKVKVDEMENLVKKLREALLQSMMNKKT
ncbi:uncharacterized protein LOC117641521 [Thrips palmi]|uniref:Uncharacterized protein LOC117641521 n=1 Tax=Thrips palmi TaxID=161013 RepID=A0A6P8Y5F2_THRPL|nr:uncharacterized protein LOC117641521 [Thrips palmi]XP_034234814.1 uncharacterized protein LOC117641521 [Thrips palmi]